MCLDYSKPDIFMEDEPYRHQKLRKRKPGTTNALRVLGKKAGLIVFAGDFLKTVFACLAARIIFKGSPDTDLYVLYAGLGVVLGHNFPCYLNFKGGKGIASMAGILVSMDWRVTLCLCGTVPWRCHHHKICLPRIDPGGDLILYPDADLRITGGLPCLRREVSWSFLPFPLS